MARIIHIVLSTAAVFAIALLVIATLKNDIVEEEGQTKRFHLVGGGNRNRNHHHQEYQSGSADATSTGVTVLNNETIIKKAFDETTTHQPIQDEKEKKTDEPIKSISNSRDDTSPEVKQQQQQQQTSSQDLINDDHDHEFTWQEIVAMRKKLAPREILRNINSGDNRGESSSAPPRVHQFLHLHHMKTGGTCKYILLFVYTYIHTATTCFFVVAVNETDYCQNKTFKK
jgi:hypothetical protein